MQSKPLHLDVHEQIECAHTLASRFYTDPTILEIEKSRIFRRTWQLVGTLSRSCGEENGVKRTIADPESFFTADLAGEPIIVVRDKQGELRAFSNVCRHRAGPIALGSGCKNVLRCQYHGWTYTLDGRLIGTPDVEGVEFFDRSTMGMVPLRCETWEQFVFVNFDLKAEPLSVYLGQIPRQARAFQFDGLQFAERRDYVIDCNWKIYVDNYLEGYHIPIAHPGLMKEIDYAQYRTDTFRFYSQQFAPIRALKAEDAGERLYAPGTGQQALYFWVFPNLMLNIYPDNISTNLIVPLSPTTRRLRSSNGFSMTWLRRRIWSASSAQWRSATKYSRKTLASAKMFSVVCALRLMTAGATPSSVKTAFTISTCCSASSWGSRNRR